MSHYHIMGIGGLGMSAIGHVLLDRGEAVSGCDARGNALTEELAARGATIMLGHSAEHLAGVDFLAISSAIHPDHPEVVAAQERGIPVLKRADLWRTWSAATPTLAVAGTHGKTTTTAMVAFVLSQLGYDPAYIVPAGGPVPGLDRFARWGSGPFVIEADEYDRLFLGLLPEVAIITNVDWDHVDIYPTPASVDEVFEQFARQVRRMTILCYEDAGARRLHDKLVVTGAPCQSYGFSTDSEWSIDSLVTDELWTSFTLSVPAEQAGSTTGSLRGRLQIPGRHNVLNAVGAIAAVAQWGVAPAAALQVLENFRGAARRFEFKGEAGGIVFIDDYAHNPAKVAATLAAARARYPQRRLVIYFQPHTFSRTKELLEPLAEALAGADVILIGNIYPSRERQEDFPGIDAALLARQVPGGTAVAVGDLAQATERLFEQVRAGDVVLTLGAGDGNRVGDEVRRRCASEAHP